MQGIDRRLFCKRSTLAVIAATVGGGELLAGCTPGTATTRNPDSDASRIARDEGVWADHGSADARGAAPEAGLDHETGGVDSGGTDAGAGGVDAGGTDAGAGGADAGLPGGIVTVVGPNTFSSALIATTQSNQAHTLVCQPGDYPKILRTKALVKPGARTTILAQDRNNPPTWRNTELGIDGLRNFTFDGLHFVNTRVDGLGFPNTGDPALQLDDCRDITIRNCTFDGWHRSFTSRRSVNLVVEWNLFTRWGMDTCRLFGRHQNLIIRSNRWFEPWIDWERATSDNPNRHPDCISIQIGSDIDRGCIDVLIERNDITTGNGYCQGIFVANANVVAGDSFETYKHQGVTIQDNITTTRHTNAIFMAGIDGVLCQRNIVRELAVVGEPVWAPGGLAQPQFVFAAKSIGRLADGGGFKNNVGKYAVAYVKGAKAANVDVVSYTQHATATPAGFPNPLKTGPYGYE